MKNLAWIIILIVFGISSTNAQQIPKEYADYKLTSGFKLDSLEAHTSQKIDNLETLARVWGYAKYHHPVFCDSTLCVDYELFELLPRVVEADKPTRNRVLLNWVKGLGAYKPNKPYYDEGMSSVQHWTTLDLAWTADTVLLGADLSALLQDLRYAEREGNHYVQSDAVRAISYDNERSYKSIVRYDCGYQLLALFRFWNIVEYYAPNKMLTDKPWHQVLREYIPRIALARDMDYLKVLMELTAELCDGHTQMWYEYYFGNRVAPIRTVWQDKALIVADPRGIAGLRRGDQITGFDGKSIATRFDDMRRYVAVSNKAGLRQNTLYYLTATPKQECVLSFKRDGRLDSLRISTKPLHEADFLDDSIKTKQGVSRFLQDSVGYIDARNLTDQNAGEIMAKFRNTKAIIIDLRSYPQYFLPFFVGEYLLEKPTEYIRFSYPTPTLPGEFYFAPGGMTLLYRGMLHETIPQENTNAYKGRIIVLVNEMTQSRGETSVMALQAAPNTLVIGSQTAGANGDITFIPLPSNVRTSYSGVGCYYPDGCDMQRKGVKIDIEVHPTTEAICAGHDEILEKALEYAK